MPADREGCCPSVLSWPAGAGRPRDCVRAGEAGTRPARGPRPRAVSGVPASRRGRGARIRRGLDRPWDAGANLALVGGDARMVEARDALAEQHRPIAGADRGLSDGGRGDHLDGDPALQPDTVNRRELPGVAGWWMERPRVAVLESQWDQLRRTGGNGRRRRRIRDVPESLRRYRNGRTRRRRESLVFTRHGPQRPAWRVACHGGGPAGTVALVWEHYIRGTFTTPTINRLYVKVRPAGHDAWLPALSLGLEGQYTAQNDITDFISGPRVAVNARDSVFVTWQWPTTAPSTPAPRS